MKPIFLPKRLVEIDLCDFAAQAAQGYVAMCEAQYQQRLDRAAAAIEASGVHIVTLTGPSSSGKTTTSHKLAEALRARGIPALVISMDNFYIGAANYPLLPDGSKDYESPGTLNMPEIHAHIKTLCDTGEVSLPIYDFIAECRAKETTHVALGGGVCIIEGIHAFNPELISLLEQEGVFRVYAGLREEYALQGERVIQTSCVRFCRRAIRDARTRGHNVEKTYSLWDKVLESEFKYIKCYKKTANFVLDTSFTYELHLIAQQLRTLASCVDKEDPAHDFVQDLLRRFATVEPLPLSYLPAESMLREFYE